MEQRVDIQTSQPEVYKAMFTLSAVINRSNLTAIQKDLIKIRASQVNSCEYCLNMHTEEALKNGEKLQRLFLLSAWKETEIFTDEEKVILALTEEVTLIHQNGVTDATYKLAEKFFSPEKIGEIIMSVVLINAWNRIAVSTHKPLGK